MFDVLVIGGGHAGAEASYASSRMNCNTALITLNLKRIGVLSCNPAMGGLAKGQLIKEIDALGGIIGINTDLSAIQYKRLNSSKGAAVRSSRTQCDKNIYSSNIINKLKNTKNLTLIQGEIKELIVKNNKVLGVKLIDNTTIKAKTIVITSGTFLKAIMHTGEIKEKGGRKGDTSSDDLSEGLKALGFKLRRLKTGTPPRIHKDSIDYSKTTIQEGDERPRKFSFYYPNIKFPLLTQVPCYITYTNEKTHEIIEKNIKRSPIFSGAIKGIGPRYCPSIEDKIHRFRDKNRHQIFLEPEGLSLNEIYVNGISTSLPKDVQNSFVKSIKGLENAEFIRYGYAVEYDALDARSLKTTLESKDIQNLFFAGQINGTSGYEEAASQGVIAGINAALKVLNKDEFILSRSDAYIGVLIDDLTLKGSEEPYRMFTSRAEFRLILREDNADIRLSKKGFDLGLLSKESYELFEKKKNEISTVESLLENFYLSPNLKTNSYLEKKGTLISDKISGNEVLKRPEVILDSLIDLGLKVPSFISRDVLEYVEIKTKYSGYIKRDMELIDKVKKSESIKIPKKVKFELISGLSNEIIGKMNRVRPETIGQMSRISGITPAAIANMLIYIKTSSKSI